MLDYFLSEAARTDLKKLYRFEYERFGEQQAERDYDALIICFEESAKSPLLYQRVPEYGVDYYRCVYISKSIYFRVVGLRVEIIAVILGLDILTRF